MNSIEKKVSKSIVYQFASFFITGIVSILFIPFTIQKLGTNQYGIYEMVLALTLINALLEIGVGSTITNYIKKYFDKDKKEYRSFFWSFFWFKLFIALIAFVVCLVIAFNVSFIFKKVAIDDLGLLKKSIIWFAFGVLMNNFVSFFDNVENGFVRFDLTSIANISSKLFYIITFFIWITNWNDIDIAQFCFITFVFVPTFRLVLQIGILVSVQRHIVPKVASFSKKNITDNINYIGGVSSITLIAQFYNYGIAFLLSLVAIPTLVGEFGIIKKVLDLVGGISDMLVRPIMPASKDLLKKHSLDKIVYNGTSIHATIVLGITTFIIINSSAISSFYLQNRYPSFNLHLIIMAIPRLFPSFIVMLMLYYGEGKTKINIFNQLRKVVISMTFGFIGFHFYDFIGLLIGLALGASIAIGFNLNHFLSYYKKISSSKFLGIYIEKWMVVAFIIFLYALIESQLGLSIFTLLLWNVLAIVLFLFFFRKEIKIILAQLNKK